MRKKLRIISGVVLAIAVFSFVLFNTNKVDEITKLKEKHKEFLANSPFKKTLKLTKKERKNLGIPANKYYEREWELTMNPNTGLPEPQNVISLQKEMRNDNSLFRAPGDASDNLWIERGPNNVGGRTRVVFFDPTDGTNNRVFAGGASGGLWKTENISTNGGWSLVTGLPTNLSITCFAIDPNDNTNSTWYLGSGEQSTYASAVGRGVYKTTDAGATWTQVLDVYDFDTDSGNVFGGVHFINDIVAWDNNGSTEIYVGVSAGFDGSTSPTNFLGSFERGLFHSTNGGTTWTKDTNVVNVSVNDFEVDANGNLWLATTNSYGFGDNGGAIYRRNTGGATTFGLVTTISNVFRTEIEASATNANKFYVLAEGASNPVMYVTTDAFATAPSSTSLPNDPDGSVSAADFTRGQAFYDLVVEADPNNDAIVYIGGINVHRSTDSGANWNTISHWSTFYSTAGSLVHADQHALTFHPTNSNLGVLGHDGGISYVSDFSATGNNLTVMTDVDDTYNVLQFYSGDIAPGSFAAGDYMVAGAQDNGTQLIQDGNTSGPDVGVRIKGGDGAYSFYDQVATDYVLGNYVYNNSIELYDYSAGAWKVVAENSNNDGDFINPSGLDSNLDMLYTNGSNGANRIYRYEDLTNLPTVTRDGSGNLTSAVATRTTLTDALLTGEPTAFDISTITTTTTTMLVGLEDGEVLLVTNADGTPSWSNIGSFVGSISDVEFGSSEQHIFVTIHNYGVSSVWYTDDQGTTWDDLEGNLPDIPVKCILQNPLLPNELIIGTSLGVWRTDSFGTDLSLNPPAPTWTQSNNGMSDVPVLDLDLRTSDNTVLATTFGRGMFTGQFDASVLTVENFESKYGLKIFPTITDGIINIETLRTIENASLKIYDINGRAFYSKELSIDNGNNEEIDITNLSSGVYFMNFEINESKETIKIIKK